MIALMVLLVAVNMNNTHMNTEEPSYFERIAPTQNPKNPKILGKWGGALASTRGFLGFWVLAGTILLKKEEGRQPTPREGRQPTPRTQKPKKPRVKGQAPSPFPQNLWVFWVLGWGYSFKVRGLLCIHTGIIHMNTIISSTSNAIFNADAIVNIQIIINIVKGETIFNQKSIKVSKNQYESRDK